MTTQITILNKQADNLLIYIEKYKAKFEERLVAYNAVGQLEWNAGSGILVRKVLHGYLKKQKIAALSGTKFLVVLRASTNEYFFGISGFYASLSHASGVYHWRDYHQVLRTRQNHYR